MSTTPEPTTPSETPEAGTTEPTTPTSGNAEAAARRRQLRETEAERDALSARVTTLQRAEVERLAADRLAEPGDLFTIAGADLADLLNEEGNVDPDKVAQATDALLDTRPGLAAPTPKRWPDMGQGNRGGTSAPASWKSVISANR